MNEWNLLLFKREEKMWDKRWENGKKWTEIAKILQLMDGKYLTVLFFCRNESKYLLLFLSWYLTQRNFIA